MSACPARPRPGIWLLAFCLLCLVCAPAQARQWPRPAGPVADYAQVLGPEAEERISALANQLWQKTQIAVVVATLPSLEGHPLEETAVDLYRDWGIGQKDVNKGLLILVAVAEKRLRLEVGYGLEGVITDARAGQIRDQVIIPRLRKGDYEEGLHQGVAAVAKEVLSASGQDISELPPVEPRPAKGSKSRGAWGGGAAGFVLLLLAVMVWRGLRQRGQGGSFWEGLLWGLIMSGGGGGGRHHSGDGSGFDSFGGGFGGFGGGMSGGGGASGDFGGGDE